MRAALDDVRAQGPLGATDAARSCGSSSPRRGERRSRARLRQSRVRPVAVRSNPRGDQHKTFRALVDAVIVLALGGSVATASAERHQVRVPARLQPIRSASSSRTTTGSGRPGSRRWSISCSFIPNSEVTVIAPAADRSGTGANFTTTPITVSPATTASGDAATAVAVPADTVLYGVLSADAGERCRCVRHDFGQNLGNVTELSAPSARHGPPNRLGIPAIAISQGFASTDQARPGGLHRAGLRSSSSGRTTSRSLPPQTLNFDVPSCPSAQPGASSWSRSVARPMSAATCSSPVPPATGRSTDGRRQDAARDRQLPLTENRFDNDIDAFDDGCDHCQIR